MSLNKFNFALSDSYSKLLDHYDPLTEAETFEYISRARNGDASAKERLLCGFFRLIYDTAKPYMAYSELAPDEVINESVLAFLKAISDYDETRGAKFSTVAVVYIRTYLRRNLVRRDRMLAIPCYAYHRISLYRKYVAEWLETHTTPPTLHEACEALGFNEKIFAQHLLNHNSFVRSLDEPIADGSEDALIDFVADEKTEHFDEAVVSVLISESCVSRMREILSPKEFFVLSLRLGLDGKVYTLKSIGERCRVTVERIRQIQRKSFQKLRADAQFVQLLRSEAA